MSAEDDFRTPAQHDTDRIAYSSALRRLEGVTQVVAVGETLLLHNRLTHTLKVAQLSRRIAQYLAHTHKHVTIDADAAEAAGLAHDLGHPPFGHIAETALNEVMEDSGGYEGNAQSFRIVTKLSRSRHGMGLQLSNTTLNGILKYPWINGDENAPKTNKWGAYASESELFDGVRAGHKTLVKSLEAEVMDWADDISYAIHDLQDFYRAGVIPLELLRDRRESQEEFLGKALAEMDRPAEEDHALETLLSLFQLVQLKSTEPGSMQYREEISRMGSHLIDHFVRQTTVSSSGVFEIDPDVRLQIHLLKQLTWQHVIENPALASVQEGQVTLIKQLFSDLVAWVRRETKKQRLPTRLREMVAFVELDEPEQTAERQTARAVSDYISGLTENQAVDLAARLGGTSRGSIQDTWLAN